MKQEEEEDEDEDEDEDAADEEQEEEREAAEHAETATEQPKIGNKAVVGTSSPSDSKPSAAAGNSKSRKQNRAKAMTAK